MGLFGKLFNKSESLDTTKKEQKIKRTIFDFFEFDLRSLPDETFIKGSDEFNTVNEPIIKYRKRYNDKLLGIFDYMEVVVFNNGKKNISLTVEGIRSISINKLRALVNDLFLIYGHDSDNKAAFNSNDIKEMDPNDEYGLFGRSWSDSDKYEYPLMISRIDSELSMTIWGVDGNES